MEKLEYFWYWVLVDLDVAGEVGARRFGMRIRGFDGFLAYV